MWKGKTVGDEVLIANYNSKNRTVTDGHLTEIFSMVGQRYGYEDVKAEFSALTDFKVRWQRSYKWAIFTVSDYLDRAPDDVLENLAEVLFSKITGQDAEYGDVFLRYVTDKELMRTNRKDFLKRSRNLTKKSIGDYHDLNDCVNRLRDQRLIPDDIECVLTWDNSGREKAAGVSVLQGVVWVSKALDQKGIPEYVLDYCVFYMMCYLELGFNPGPDMEYDHRRLIAKHPMRYDAESWLNEHGLFL